MTSLHQATPVWPSQDPGPKFPREQTTSLEGSTKGECTQHELNVSSLSSPTGGLPPLHLGSQGICLSQTVSSQRGKSWTDALTGFIIIAVVVVILYLGAYAGCSVPKSLWLAECPVSLQALSFWLWWVTSAAGLPMLTLHCMPSKVPQGTAIIQDFPTLPLEALSSEQKYTGLHSTLSLCHLS